VGTPTPPEVQLVFNVAREEYLCLWIRNSEKELVVLILLPDGTVSELRRADPRVDSIGLGQPCVNLLGGCGVYEARAERVLLAPDDPDLVAVAARERSDAGALDGVDIGRVQGACLACLDGHLPLMRDDVV
jgi:hypothetical protein